MDNGPGRELSGSHEDETVYCVDCGNVFVFQKGRDCPTCYVDERLDELQDDGGDE